MNSTKSLQLQPVFRVRRRGEAIGFFEKFFGQKLLLEEGPLVYLGSEIQGKKSAQVLLEESPSTVGYSRNPGQNLQEATLFSADKKTVKKLLQENFQELNQIYEKNGAYGYQVLSREGAKYFLLSNEISTSLRTIDDLESYRVHANTVKFDEADPSPEDSDSPVITHLVINNGEGIEKTGELTPLFSVIEESGRQVELTRKSPKVGPYWDLEAVRLELPEAKLTTLIADIRAKFEDLEIYLDAKERLASISLRSGLEIWLEAAEF